jgi:hypothetical protein
MLFFIELGKRIPKRAQIAKEILSEKSNARCIAISDFKAY